jgi:membrane-bound lytic murein transglycosylase A
MRRQDRSGLTQPGDWNAVCAEAASLPDGYAASFFFYRFDWARVGDGKAFATGYYEPELAGSRTRAPGYEVPIYRTPPDLIRCTRADGQTGRGRIDQSGRCVLYFTRGEIEDGALANKGLELAWAADPIELFFLQIQGSGRLKLPDGSVMRLGYDNQNGREYVAIGRLLRDRGLLPQGGARMQDIVAWIRANPDQGRALMRENLSYVFFRELTGPGPLGSINVPVVAQASVAVDPLFVPYGAPVFLTLDRPEANGLWVAQDTGGAIKGANRFDTFWGAGPYATATAGGMSASGQALILLPKGSVARALARP